MVNMRAPQFDWKINLGHLISIGTVLVVGLLAWANLSRDVSDAATKNASQDAKIEIILDKLAANDVGRTRLESQLEFLGVRMTEVLQVLNREEDHP